MQWHLKIVALYQRRYLFRTNFFFLLAQVGTCLRVQELKILCFYLLSFQRYEAKTNDDSSFSQFSRIFLKLTIAHCVFMVPPSAFIFSGIVRLMKNSIFEFWNFEIFATRWLWLCLFTFRFWLILGMLQGGFLWFLSMRSTNYIILCREKNKPTGGFPFWGFIYDFVILNFKELRQI